MAFSWQRRSIGGAAAVLSSLWHTGAMTGQSSTLLQLADLVQSACTDAGNDTVNSMCDLVRNSSCYQPPGPNGCPQGCELHVKDACGISDLCIDAQFCSLLYPSGYTSKPNEEDPSYKECSKHCAIVGCKECEGPASCKTCHGFFTLMTPEDPYVIFGIKGISGTCRWNWTLQATVILSLLFVIFVLLVISACKVHMRGCTNTRAVNAGMLSRYRAKVFKHFEEGQPRYEMWAPMHLHEKGRVQICGPGMTLFMNWFILLAGVGLWLTVLALIFTKEYQPSDPCHQALNRGFPAWGVDDVSAHKSLWAALAYLGSTLGSFIFFVTQRKMWTAMTHDTTGEIPIELYTVEASGFPPDATDKQKLLQYFQQGLSSQHLPADSIEYISIAYKYGEDDHWVEAALDRHLEEEQNLHKPSDMSYAEDVSSDSSDDERNSSDVGPWWLKVVAWLLLGTAMDWPVRGKGKHNSDQSKAVYDSAGDSLEQRLQSLRSSGRVFIVLRTQALAVALQSLVEMPDPYEGHLISLRKVRAPPRNIFWDKFGISKKTKGKRIVVSFFILILTVIFWFICYFPVAWVYFVTLDSAETSLAVAVQSAMAMTIVIGNATLGAVANAVTDWIGFRMQRELLLARLVIIVPVMLLNVIMDLSTLVLMPTLHKFATWSNDFKVPSSEIVRELHSNALGLLSSYCVVPYFGEPLFCIYVVFLVALWRIKRDPRITPHQAEKLMLAPKTDIVNPPYCDFICTTTIIVVTFTIAPSRQHRFIFPWLLVAAAVLYVQCRFRILRWESRSYYGSVSLHNVEAVYWALPLGLLAAAWERNGWTSDDPFQGRRFFCLHVFVHLLFLRYVVPQWERQMPACRIEYKEALQRLGGKACLADYLNTNPIEVLKSHFQRETSSGRRLIYYRLDKEYLQERAASKWSGEESYRSRLFKVIDMDHGLSRQALLNEVGFFNMPRSESSSDSSDDNSVDSREPMQH